jgi:hypothetical protein
MFDPWMDSLSAYLDGDLSEADRAALEQHLASCDECRRTLAELRSVVAAADALHDREPTRDLWTGIATRIAAPEDGVVRLPAARSARQFSFSVPQLAAAAVLIMSLTGTAVWYAANRSEGSELAAGTIVQSSGGSVRSVSSAPLPDPEYPADIASLERALEQNRAQLDPATVEVLERSLESIDRAIEDARAALDSDPGNPYLHRQLDNTMRKKVDILRRATRAS